MDDLDF